MLWLKKLWPILKRILLPPPRKKTDIKKTAKKKHSKKPRLVLIPVLLGVLLLGGVYQYVFAEGGGGGTVSNVSISVYATPKWPVSPATVPVQKLLWLNWVSDTEILIRWTPPTGTNNTMIRAAYGAYPESITEGYEVYDGNGIEVSDTGVDLDNSISDVYYTLFFQDAGGNWFDAIEGSIGGNGMTNLVQYGLIFGLVVFTFWRRDIFLYLITCPLSIVGGLQFFQTYHTPFGFVIGIILIAVGIYSLYLGIFNIMNRGD